jgi:DNA-binding IclR family transcriptional regulator
VLADLRDEGYVRQDHAGGAYRLTARIVALGFTFLGAAGVTSKIQPILDRLAEKTGELVLLAVINSGRLLRLAKAQGAYRGVLYNPDESPEVFLATTSNGHAWLSCLSDEEVLELVAKQGFKREGDGPRAPKTIGEIIEYVNAARKRGFAKIFETFEAGTSAMAAPILRPGTKTPIGTISVAGPLFRVTDEYMDRFAPLLLASAAEIASFGSELPIFEQVQRSQ